MDNATLIALAKQEYVKCAADPAYFMMKYCKIQHPSKGTIPFDLFPFQADTLRLLRDNPKNIILKCRQMGISTLTAGYSMWLMTFHSDKSILVIATTQDTAKNLVKKVQVMQDNLPSWMKSADAENNRTSLRLANGSSIQAVSSSSSSGRSHALSLLIVDEAAFIPTISDIWVSVQSALNHGGGNAIILSTPNGIGNFFHTMWKESEEGKQKFKTIKLHWSLHPEYDQKWRYDQDILLGAKMAAQECDCSFESSGNSLIDLAILEWYKKEQVKEPIAKEYIDGNYWKWYMPDYKKKYVLSADVSRGDGNDYSTFHVLDLDNLEQVAEYQGKIDTIDFGNLLVQVATEWNDALMIVENSTIGWSSIQQVIDRGYKNLFYMTEDLKYVDPDKQFSNKFNTGKKGVAGFTMSIRTRPLVISKIELLVRQKEVKINSVRLINELMTFIWHNGKVQSAPGYNDDLAMAFGIGLWVYDTALTLRNQGIEMQRLVLNGMSRKSVVENGIYSSDQIHGKLKHDPYLMRTGKTTEDLRWLIK